MNSKAFNSSIFFVGLLFVVLAGFYIAKSGQYTSSSVLIYFPLVGQVGLDIIAGILCLKLYSLRSDNTRLFFKYLSIAFFFGAIADLSYNIIINALHLQMLTPLLASIYDIPFALFLFFQALAWGIIFKKIISDKAGKPFLIYLI